VATTAIVLAAVPLGMALLGGSDSPEKKNDVVVSTRPPAPDGWRWESWRNVQIAVPGDWTAGAASQWCVANPEPAGTIDRGEGVSTLVACTPGVSSSVTFRPGIAKHPLIDIKGVGKRLTFDGNTVDVVAPDQATLDKIVATAEQFASVDSRGCAPAIQDLAEPLSGEAAGPLTVCRYIGWGNAYELAESRDLTEQESADWLAALASAPAVPESSNACDPGYGSEAILVRSADGAVAFLELDGCGGGYVKTADGEKALSNDLAIPLGSQLTTFG
jgi:hypothetical protein